MWQKLTSEIGKSKLPSSIAPRARQISTKAPPKRQIAFDIDHSPSEFAQRSPTMSGSLARRFAIAAIAGILILVINAYVQLTATALDGGGFAPAWSDEFVYAATARSFAANNLVQEAVLLSESTAKLWGLGTHGFVYTLLDGHAIRCFGGSGWVKPGLNGLLAACALLLCVWQARKLEPARVLAAPLVFLTSFILPIYAFTYMQEVSHIAVAVLIWTLTVAAAGGVNRRFAAAALWLVIMAAALARPNWVLATTGLVAFSKSRRQFFAFSALAAASTIGIAITVPLFNAPFPFGFLPNALAALPQEGWHGFLGRIIGNAWTNQIRYFTRMGSPSIFYFLSKYFYSAVVAYLLYFGWRHKNRLALAAGVMAFTQWLALCFFYDAYDWREHRILAPFIVMAGLAVNACCSSRALAAYLTAAVLLWSGFADKHAVPMLKDHTDSYRRSRQQNAEVNAIAGLAGAIDERGTVTIILPEKSLGQSTFMNALPVRSAGGGPIRYTVNLDGDPYQRHGLVPVRYALLLPGPTPPNTEQIYSTPFLTLVRFTGDPKPPPPGVTMRTVSPAIATN